MSSLLTQKVSFLGSKTYLFDKISMQLLDMRQSDTLLSLTVSYKPTFHVECIYIQFLKHKLQACKAE